MAEDCIFIKKPYSLCTNSKKKYKFEIIRPEKNGGKCEYTFFKDSSDARNKINSVVDLNQLRQKNMINEEYCDELTDECNAVSEDYKEVIKCILKKVIDTFVDKFNKGPGNCSSDKIIRQRSTVFIGPDFDGATCSVEINQSIDLTSKKICLDINKILADLGGDLETKRTLIEDVVNDTFKYYNNPIVYKKTLFIEKLKDLIFDRLMNIDMTINAGCSQKVYVGQDQNIYLLGKILCENSKFEFTQSAIVKAYMRCITEPFMDDLVNQPELKRLFNINESINRDCIINKILVQGCNSTPGKPGQRKFKIDILIPQAGNGSCEYQQNQIISEECSTKLCETSDWDEWSPCVEEVQFTSDSETSFPTPSGLRSGVGTQFRKRTLKKDSDGKVIGGGENCPSFEEKRICYIPKLTRKNINQKLEIPPPKFATKKGYEWLLYGPEYMTESQKTILKVVVSVIICLWIYVLIK